MTTPATLLARLNTRRRVSVFACAMLTATLGVFGPTGTTPAHAEVVELQCAGTQTATYYPGLTLIQRKTTVTVNGALTPCKSSDPKIVSATYKFTGQGQFSCAVTSQGPFEVTYRFNNGKSSTARYVSTVNQKVVGGSVVISTGTVVSGLFKGDMATRTVADVTSQAPQCATSDGVTSTTGATTVTFTRL